MNRVFLVGRVGGDPKLFGSSKNVLKFSLATDESFKAKDGTWKSEVTWHNCVVFGQRAEALHSKLRKGDVVIIDDAAIKHGDYEKDGQKVKTTDIVVNHLLLPSYEARGSVAGKTEGPGAGGDFPSGGGGFEGDDLPF